MKNRYRPLWLLLTLLLPVLTAQAQLEPAAQYTKLSVSQLLAWTPTGPTAALANVSRVPLAPRQNALAPQLNPGQSFSHKVNYIPDGMSGFGGYINEQQHFNLFNFTHWQYIDVLTWFDGPVAMPTRPWTEAAHRNGVKVIGTVFSSAADVNTLIQKDAAGNYIAAQKLVDVANYYGFDGWFFNQETSVSAATALEIRNMLKQLQLLRPAGMEIHWYDAMLPTGPVNYQNALNTNNQLLLQDGNSRVSDAMFTNYFWSGANNINTSVNTANALGRSPFEVYMGADLWPNRSNQSLFNQTAWIENYFTGGNLAQPKLSLGLFATNLTYNGGFNSFSSNANEYAAFYRTEQRLFAGNDLDPVVPDATGWKGFGHYVPVRSVINTLPFETFFSVGQGKVFANQGAQIAKSWTDIGRQSVLPSWQWAKTGAAAISAGFDFSRAWYAGTSVRFAGSLSGSNDATVKLYQTKLPLVAASRCEVVYKAGAAGPSNTKLALYFTDNLAVPELLDLPAVTDTLWHTGTFALSTYAGRELAIIGLRATATAAVPAYALNIGKLRLDNGAAVAAAPTVGFSATPTVALVNQPVSFANYTLNATAYAWTFAGGTPASSTASQPTVRYAAPGTYAVKLRAENSAGRDSLTRTAYVTVVAPGSPGSNTALLYDGVAKNVDAGPINLSGSAFTMECWVKVNAFKLSSPFISSILGMEDGGPNTALLRLGDAGLAADRLQFAVNLGGTVRKLASVSALRANTWQHVAATYDGSAMKIYIDGVLDATLNASGPAVANATFTFGRNYANSRTLDGSIDEVRVWKRARTAAEILANPCDVPPSSAGLEGYWKCDEGSGSITQDLTGHGHTGTLLNMLPTDWTTNVPTQCATTTAVLPGTKAADLQILVFGNPVPGRHAEIELLGAARQEITLQVTNVLGATTWQQMLAPAAATGRLQVPLPAAPGLYVLRVRTATGAASVKLLRE